MTMKLKNIIIAPLALMSLSACVYGDGYGQSNFGYADDQYCDPYNEYDAYYGCDLDYGFANFGYGGGWYQDYYYPGFGFFIFDNAGRRYRMNDYYLGYWGRERQRYFQSRFSNRRFSGYRLRSFPWSERHGKRYVRDDSYKASRRIDHRKNRTDERFYKRQDGYQAGRDRRDQNDNIDNRQRNAKRDRSSDRSSDQRRSKRSERGGAREPRRHDNPHQAGNRASQPPRSRPPQNRQQQAARPPQNRQEGNKPPSKHNKPPRARNNTQNNNPPRTRPPRIKQNNRPSGLRDNVREPHRKIP